MTNLPHEKMYAKTYTLQASRLGEDAWLRMMRSGGYDGVYLLTLADLADKAQRETVYILNCEETDRLREEIRGDEFRKVTNVWKFSPAITKAECARFVIETLRHSPVLWDEA